MLRILHVDDKKEDFEVVKIHLQRLNSELDIDWIGSATEALSEIEKQEYSCILCDYQMDVMDGLHLLKDLRDRGDITPFIFLTGQGNEEVAAEALRAGADDYYTKRVGFAHYQRLMNSITRVIEAHRIHLEHQEAQEALKESEAIYRLVADLTSNYIFSIRFNPDNTLETEWVDGEYARIHEYDEPDFGPDGWIKSVHPDDIQKAREVQQRYLENKPNVFEYRIITKSGKIRWVRHLGVPKWDEKEERTVSIIGAVQDITEQKRAMEILQQSHEELERRVAERTEELRKARDELEVRVQERTTELSESNEQLKQEIAERMRIEENLRKLKELYKMAADLSTCYTFSLLVTPEGSSILEWREGEYDKIYKGLEMYGEPDEAFKTVYPDDLPLVDSILKKVFSNHNVNEQIRTIDSEKCVHWTQFHLFPQWDEKEGRVVRFLGAVREITEQKLEESIRESLYNISEAAITTENLSDLCSFIHGIINNVIIANNIYFSLFDHRTGRFNFHYFGNDAGDALQTETFWKSLTEYVIRLGEPLILDPEKFNQLLAQGEIENLEIKPSNWLGMPLKTPQKNIGVLAIWINREDIKYGDYEKKFLKHISTQVARAIERKKESERFKRRSQQLEERTRQLTAANKELEAFSYSVSHDLQSPLLQIDGYTELLAEKHLDKLNEEGRDCVNHLRSAAEKMDWIINDLLKLSRVATGELKHERINLSALAREVADDLRLEHPDHQVELTIADDITADADARLMRVVLENLLDNAWKFTSRTKNPRVEFSAKTEGDKTVYFIRDNGAGFDLSKADKLFVPFQRLHRDDEFGGTGIGLATVQRVIHRHGGQIWAEGKPNKGAAFFFRLD